MHDEMFLVTGISEGEKVRLMRLAKHLRQIDIASQASVNLVEVIRLEKNGYVRPHRKKRILDILGLLDDQPGVDHAR